MTMTTHDGVAPTVRATAANRPVAHGEEPVSTGWRHQQRDSQVAVLADGSYVVVWRTASPDGSADGIHAQRFAANGVPRGLEWRIDPASAGARGEPSITALSHGGFAVSWSERQSENVLIRQFDASGKALGGAAVLSETTQGEQRFSQLAGYNNGFAAVYASNQEGSNGLDVYLRRFGNDGNAQGGEVRVSVVAGSASGQPGHQTDAQVAARPDGSLVIVWTDQGGADGSSHGVYFSTVSATGAPTAPALVNTATAGAQYEPSVALLSNGGFVVVWRTDGAAGGATVMAQRFDATGSKQGEAFRVSDSPYAGQYQASVSAALDGGFTVAYFNDAPDGFTRSDVMVRDFDASGNPKGASRKLESVDNGTESEPAIAHLGQGNHVVTYSNFAPAGRLLLDAPEVVQQIIGGGDSLVRSFQPTTIQRAVVPEVKTERGLTGLDLSWYPYVATLGTIPKGSVLDVTHLSGSDGSDVISFAQSNGFWSFPVTPSGTLLAAPYNYELGTVSGGSNGSNLQVRFTSDVEWTLLDILLGSLAIGAPAGATNGLRNMAVQLSNPAGDLYLKTVLDALVVRGPTPKVFVREPVSTWSHGYKHGSEIAALKDGGYVVVWNATDQDGSGDGVYAQRFTSTGLAIGPEWRVNGATAGDQNQATVTALGNGGFVVGWSDRPSADVLMQRYSADGLAQGGATRISASDAGDQAFSQLAGYAGGYAAVYASQPAGGDGGAIYLRRFKDDGTPQGTEQLVSVAPDGRSDQTGTQSDPQVAARADGSLVIVWTDQGGADGSSHGVYARLVHANGEASLPFLVNTKTTGAQYEASVATLADGSFVVVWRDEGVGPQATALGQRFDASGTKLGDAFRIAPETWTGPSYQARVVALDGINYAVAFFNGRSTQLVEFSGSGFVNGRHADAIYLYDPSVLGYVTTNDPSMAYLGQGKFVVNASAQSGPYGESRSELVQTLYGGTEPVFGRGPDGGSSYYPRFYEDPTTTGAGSAPTRIFPNAKESWSFSNPFDNARLDVFFLRGQDGKEHLQLLHQGTGAGQVGLSGSTLSYGGLPVGTWSGGQAGAALTLQLNAAATPDAAHALLQAVALSAPANAHLGVRELGVRLTNGWEAETHHVVAYVTARAASPVVHGEERVNSQTRGFQTDSTLAVLADGSYVVVWVSSEQDGSGSGIYAQRLAGNGSRIGPEWRVNTLTAGEQTQPTVTALKQGGFVVGWTDRAMGDVLMQRYSADAQPLGAATRSNGTSPGEQAFSQLAGYTGGYAAVYVSDHPGSNGQDVYLRRFNSDGVPQGSETRLSGTEVQGQGGNQSEPRVAARADGSLVVVWTDQGGNDGSSHGVYARLVGADGSLGSPLLVNTQTAGAQYQANVALLSGGGFVVVWRQDLEGKTSSYVQRFDAAGAKLGEAVALTAPYGQAVYQATVAGLPDGSFAVAQFGSWGSIYVQEFAADGSLIGASREVRSRTGGHETQPALASLGDGSMVLTYTDFGSPEYGLGTMTGEIAQQLLGSAASLARSAAPQLQAELASAAGLERGLAATPLLVAVGLRDADNATLNGGRLDLYFLGGQDGSEQLGILHQGTGAGQIGVSGSAILYGGAVMGSFSGGSAGSGLVVRFNAQATVAAVDALLESVTVSVAATAALGTRHVVLQLSDGAGASTQWGRDLEVVSVAATPRLRAEERVHADAAGTQRVKEVTVLRDGSYWVTWRDGEYFLTDLKGQRFSPDGGKLGALKTFESYGTELAPTSDGGFVAFDEDLGTLQRFSARGDAIGEPTRLASNHYTTLVSYDSGYALLGSGHVARFSNAGLLLKEERISERASFSPWSQHDDVAASSDGTLVWVMSSLSYKTREVLIVNPDNTHKVLPEALTFSSGVANYAPVGVASLTNGNFVVVWRQQGTTEGTVTVAQLFNAQGDKLGPSFRVSPGKEGEQYDATVAATANGGFVVAYYNELITGSTSQDVFTQEYDASGNRVGAARKIESKTGAMESQPTLGSLPNGNYVLAYSDFANAADGGNDTVDVMQQLFGRAPAKPSSAPAGVSQHQLVPEVSSASLQAAYLESAVPLMGVEDWGQPAVGIYLPY